MLAMADYDVCRKYPIFVEAIRMLNEVGGSRIRSFLFFFRCLAIFLGCIFSLRSEVETNVPHKNY